MPRRTPWSFASPSTGQSPSHAILRQGRRCDPHVGFHFRDRTDRGVLDVRVAQRLAVPHRHDGIDGTDLSRRHDARHRSGTCDRYPCWRSDRVRHSGRDQRRPSRREGHQQKRSAHVRHPWRRQRRRRLESRHRSPLARSRARRRADGWPVVRPPHHSASANRVTRRAACAPRHLLPPKQKGNR